MIYFFSFLLMVGAVGYLALPLFRGTREEPDTEPDEASELEAQKTAAYTAIKELQFDYELGNLTPDDHQDLETKYRRRAARILKELDEVKTPQFDNLEAEIMKKRKGGGAVGDDDLEREIAARRTGTIGYQPVARGYQPVARGYQPVARGYQPVDRGYQPVARAAAVSCPRCGKPQRAEARFCTSCGAGMSPIKASCPSCGQPFLPEDRFCPECGASLKKENK